MFDLSDKITVTCLPGVGIFCSKALRGGWKGSAGHQGISAETGVGGGRSKTPSENTILCEERFLSNKLQIVPQEVPVSDLSRTFYKVPFLIILLTGKANTRGNLSVNICSDCRHSIVHLF
jgi:hypothetical protein